MAVTRGWLLVRLYPSVAIVVSACDLPEADSQHHPDDLPAVCAAYDQASVIARTDTLPEPALGEHLLARSICDDVAEPDPYGIQVQP